MVGSRSSKDIFLVVYYLTTLVSILSLFVCLCVVCVWCLSVCLFSYRMVKRMPVFV